MIFLWRSSSLVPVYCTSWWWLPSLCQWEVRGRILLMKIDEINTSILKCKQSPGKVRLGWEGHKSADIAESHQRWFFCTSDNNFHDLCPPLSLPHPPLPTPPPQPSLSHTHMHTHKHYTGLDLEDNGYFWELTIIECFWSLLVQNYQDQPTYLLEGTIN